MTEHSEVFLLPCKDCGSLLAVGRSGRIVVGGVCWDSGFDCVKSGYQPTVTSLSRFRSRCCVPARILFPADIASSSSSRAVYAGWSHPYSQLRVVVPISEREPSPTRFPVPPVWQNAVWQRRFWVRDEILLRYHLAYINNLTAWERSGNSNGFSLHHFIWKLTNIFNWFFFNSIECCLIRKTNVFETSHLSGTPATWVSVSGAYFWT